MLLKCDKYYQVLDQSLYTQIEYGQCVWGYIITQVAYIFLKQTEIVCFKNIDCLQNKPTLNGGGFD